MTNSSFPIVLSLLAFLATAGLCGLGLGVALWARLRGHPALVRPALLAAGTLLGCYLVGLLLAGGASGDRIVPAGGEKYFCELDCHLAYAVTEVRRDGAGDGAAYLVSLRTRFDETTISPRRGTAAPTWPGPRRMAVVGSDGRRYAITEAAEPGSTPLDRELRPGEQYVTLLRAQLPAGIAPMNLVLEDAIALSPLLIGNERSPLHGVTLLALPVGTAS